MITKRQRIQALVRIAKRGARYDFDTKSKMSLCRVSDTHTFITDMIIAVKVKNNEQLTKYHNPNFATAIPKVNDPFRQVTQRIHIDQNKIIDLRKGKYKGPINISGYLFDLNLLYDAYCIIQSNVINLYVTRKGDYPTAILGMKNKSETAILMGIRAYYSDFKGKYPSLEEVK